MTARIDEPRPRASLARALTIGLVLGSLLACAIEIGRMVVGRNKHEVVPGRFYRTAQLNPQQLDRFVREKNIKTVVNLRGRPFNEWHPNQSKTTQALGISQEDVTTSANRLPSPTEIRRLVEIFDHSEYPLMVHCQQGADRTGLASAMYMMLHTDADYATARHQCSPRYGHMPIHTAVAMDDFFDQYEDWLASKGEGHSPDRFRHWATQEYCPGPGRARLELLQPPSERPFNEAFAFSLRAYNTSRETWHFKAGSQAGVFVRYVVHDASAGIAYEGKAGFLNADVTPGSFIDLTLPIPALPRAGRYVLWVDLSQRNVSFTQYGSEPLTHDWEARDPAPPRGR